MNKKPSELFEGENSSLRKTFDETTSPTPKVLSREVEERFRQAFHTFLHKDDHPRTYEICKDFLAEELERQREEFLNQKANVHDQEVRKQAFKEVDDQIIKWLRGLDGDFPDLSQNPHYKFRTELRERWEALTAKLK